MVKENGFQKSREKELPTPEIHANNEVEISERRYKKIGETFAMIIKENSNLSVPEKTIQEWKVLSFSTRIIDNKLDSIVDPAERLKFTQEIINFLKGKEVDFSNEENINKAMLGVKNLIVNSKENQGESFINSLSNILKITEKIKTEKNPRTMVKLTRLEGQIAARLYLSFLPQEFRLSEKYRQLVHAFTRLGRAANSLDSFIDLPGDYHNKEVQVPPTILNRTLFLGAVLSDGLSIIKDIGLSKDLAKRFLLAIKHVVRDSPKNSKVL